MEKAALLRRQLEVTVLTREQIASLEVRLAEVIDAGNKVLGLEVTPREENGLEADVDTAGPVHLFNKV